MKDKYGRVIDYVRISVTDRCNLRCVYCMPKEGVRSIPHDKILRFDEIIRICRILAEMGITKIKLTGGEPLVRRGITDLVADLKKIPGIESLTLTTNGLLLEGYYDALADAGVDAITISLDTLNPSLYREITRRDELEAVKRGMRLAVDKGRMQVKINCVPMGGLKNQDLVEIAALAREQDIHVRFIEMMPIGLGRRFDFASEEVIRKKLEEKFGKFMPCYDVAGNGPCHYFKVPDFKGRIGFISAVSHKFCSECNRVRLTSEGFLKTCLQYEVGADLREILRRNAETGNDKNADQKNAFQGMNQKDVNKKGMTQKDTNPKGMNQKDIDRELKMAIEQAISEKPIGHNFDKKNDSDKHEHRIMSQIGG